jgi:probable F420-dependent oxidoreductase
MRYGVIFSFQDPDDSPIGHVAMYDAALRQVCAAEEQGYAWVNLTEHHFTSDGYLPALIAVLAAMSAVTDTIRLSTGMLLLPLHHPLQVAEETAVLDVLSKGRVTLGVSAGYRRIEFDAFGIDFETRGRRFDESLEVLRLAWSGERFAFNGEFFQIPLIDVRPLPVQRPGIPLWIGGTSESALRRCVSHRSPCFPGSTADIVEIAAITARYDQLRADVGDYTERQLVVPRLAVVADTVDEARKRALPAVHYMFQTYQSWGVPYDFSDYLQNWSRLDELVIVGDEARCAELAQLYAEMGTTDLLLQFALPTIPPTLASESQVRFSRIFTSSR